MLAFTFLAACLIHGIVTVFIFRQGRKNASYILFFWLSLVTLCWMALNYLSLISTNPDTLILVVRFIMASAALQVFLFYLFASKFPDNSWKAKDSRFVKHALITLVVLVVCLSPLLFESIVVRDSAIQADVGIGVAFFAVYVAFYVALAFRTLIRKYRSEAGMQRAQLFIVILAACINWIVVPLTHFVLTLTLRSLVFVIASPLFGLLFASLIAHALSKHYLFDVKKSLRDSTIYVSYYLRKRTNRTIEFYQLETMVDRSASKHIALDFSGVESIDRDSLQFIRNLKANMREKDKKLYFVGYTDKVFRDIKQIMRL